MNLNSGPSGVFGRILGESKGKEATMANEQGSSAASKQSNIWMRISKAVKKNAFILVVLIPVLIHFLIFEIFPLGFSLFVSFFDWPLGGNLRFVGLQNWSNLFHDSLIGKSLLVTLNFALYYILPTIVLGLALALLINNKFKGMNLFKSIYFFPSITSIVILAGIWKWLFTGEPGGIVNTLLMNAFGVPCQQFLSGELPALLVTVLLSIYKVSGYIMIYFYAGLKGIPATLYESAKIDGSNWRQTFFHITLPQLRPIFLYVVIISTIDILQIFESPYILTKGGPNYATNTIVYQIYKTAFIDMNLGYACSIAYVLFSIILLITLLQYKVLDKDVSYD
ncbi:MAG: sugar ABC transporter permease [Clostridiaceae bacterium]